METVTTYTSGCYHMFCILNIVNRAEQQILITNHINDMSEQGNSLKTGPNCSNLILVEASLTQ